MGNYIIKYRVPPPTPDEDERNHPSYYNWTIPKWQPFLSDEPADSKSPKEGASSSKEPLPAQNAPQKEPARVPESVKDALTSKVDINSTKPPNVGTKSASKSTSKSTSGGAPKNGQSSIKKVDSTRPHTVDQKKYGGLETQAAAKAATNIHATSSAKKAST